MDFKVQVQEWKNVLLRGKDSAQRERYWAAFQTQERIVVQDASELLAELPPRPRAGLGASLQPGA